ncbi:MAG TPA: sugar phosphate isomerase/epimerase [Armatimonadetes bacterium]|nr:sugar phosphate isomerase/epimerase [Armatimonadota bacterium]
MKQSYHGLMSLGLVHPMAFPETMQGKGPVVETVARLVNDEFFGAIEITSIPNPEVRGQVASLLQQSGMDVIFAAQPQLLMAKLDLNALEAGPREPAMARMKECVDEAYEVGARIMALMSGPDPGEAQREAAKEVLVAALKEICLYAQERATDYVMSISLENFDREVDKKSLIGPTAEAVEIAKQVREECQNFGLLVDLSHLPLLQEDAAETLSTAADYLIQIHVGNCVLRQPDHPAYGDQHPRFGIPGGENEVEELRYFLETLIYTGYFQQVLPTRMPVVSFEVKPLPGESSEAVIANAKRTFLRAWAQIGEG